MTSDYMSSSGLVIRLCSLIAGILITSNVQAQVPDRHECLMEPMVVTEVGSPVQGVIDQLLVDRSDFVKRGQPIVALDARAEKINLVYAKARAAMDSEVSAREADQALAMHNLARVQKLHDQNLVPAQKWDEALAQKLVASAALSQARETLDLLGIEVTRAEQSLTQRTILSPVDGVVVEQQAFAGEFVYDNPLMTIAQLDPLRVEVVLPARLFGSFKPGGTALIYPEIGSDKPLRAEIQVVDRLLDTRSGTFGVRLTLPNPDLSIPGGQKCELEFQPRADLVSIDE